MYIKLWAYYYYTKKDYLKAADTSVKAFIKASDIDEQYYRIALVLMYAKSLQKSGNIIPMQLILEKQYI